MSNHTLYLCYFGLREPLVQTQVLPYLREIKKIDGLKASILTFEPDFKEKWSDDEIEAQKRKLAAEGISWYALPYHKSPSVPATLYDTFKGAMLARKLIKEKGVNILHARVHVPALMGAIAKKLSRKKVKLLFDIRGLFPEEYTDAGRWKKDGMLYHSVKRIERWLLKVSDGFVVLTERGKKILFPENETKDLNGFSKPIEVIPCCVDFKSFENVNGETRRKIREHLNIEDRYVIIYVGSFGGWYMTDEMLEFFAAAREHNPNAFTLILTQRDQDKIAEKLKAKGFSENDFLVTSSLPAEIPEYLSGADVALSFIEACYSKQASSPTKIAEYLAGGLPVILNPGVGDLDELVETDKVAVAVKEFKKENYLQALSEADNLRKEETFSDKCRMSARRRFDLYDVGGERYRRLYKKLLDE